MSYASPNWLGFGGSLNVSEGSNTYGGLPNLPDGWFIGGESRPVGWGFDRGAAFSTLPSFAFEGAQFGYGFKGVGGMPVKVFAGFDTLKYTPSVASLPAFDTTSTTFSGYSSAHVGVEFRPTSNLSLSFGVGYTQQSGRIDAASDAEALQLLGASPYAFGGHR